MGKEKASTSPSLRRTSMKICLRLHMSKIFDSGWASKLLELFRSYGDVTAVVSGTTSTAAIMDSGLDVTPLRERFVD